VTPPPLGKLERITDLRQIWANEAREFTPWLARRENLTLLGEAIGFGSDGIELIDTEKPVGPFSADVFCRDARFSDPQHIVIENQLTKSDHDHLGKVITYAAGLEATTVVIIAEKFRDEHRSAMTWLNGASKEGYNFFAVEIELWRIGDSPVAPKFEVVVAPDNWVRQVQQGSAAADPEEMTDRGRLNQRYWTLFRDFALPQCGSLQFTRKPSGRNYFRLPLGRTNFELNVSVNNFDNWIRAGLTLYGQEAKAWHSILHSERAALNDGQNPPFFWDFDPNRTKQHILLNRQDVDVLDEADWPNQHAWLLAGLKRLHNAFAERIRTLDADDWDESDGGAD